MRILIVSPPAGKPLLRFDSQDHEYHFCLSPNQIPGALDAFRPQLAMLDEEASGESTVDILHEIWRLAPPLTYLVSLTQQTSINEMCQRMTADALLHPDDTPDQTFALLRAYQNRQPYLSSGILVHMECPLARSRSLSKHEKQVLELIWSEKTCHQIADHLGRSKDTIKNHRKSIKRQLGLYGGKDGLLNFKKLCGMAGRVSEKQNKCNFLCKHDHFFKK